MYIEELTNFDTLEESIDVFTGKIMDSLAIWLLYWRKRYYCDGVSEIEDTDYDKLEHLLRELEERFPHLQVEWSPTKCVGSSDIDDYKRVSNVCHSPDWRDQIGHAITIISLIH